MAIHEVKAEITGIVWRVLCKAGDHVVEDEALVILELMKMEIPVIAPCAGTVRDVRVREGDVIAEGQAVAVLES